MAGWNPNVWGPHPKHAILPAVMVLGIIGWIASANRQPIDSPTATRVTALKPVENGPPAIDHAAIPIEARYGVPSDRTMHLWTGRGGW